MLTVYCSITSLEGGHLCRKNCYCFLISLNPEELIRYGGFYPVNSDHFRWNRRLFLVFPSWRSVVVHCRTAFWKRVPGCSCFRDDSRVIIAAVAGSTTGYFTGLWAGNYLKNWKENFFFKRSISKWRMNSMSDMEWWHLSSAVSSRWSGTFVTILAEP